MKLVLFKSCREPEIFGFTADVAGKNLPVEFGPWLQADYTIEVGESGSLAGFGASRDIIEGIQRDGFFLARSGPSVTVRGGAHR